MKNGFESIISDRSLRHVLFQKGNVLFREGEICRYVGFLKSGELKISSFDHHGNEVLYNVIVPGGLFGNNLIFSSDPAYKGDVTAEKDGEIVLISAEELLLRLQKDREFLLSYLAYQSDFGKNLNARIKLLSFDKAEDRLFYQLYSHQGTLSFPSISSFAGELGLKRETLSRLLSRLEKEGTLLRTGNTIRLSEFKEER